MKIKGLFSFFAISILLIGCSPKADSTKPITVKSVDNQYSLQILEGAYQDQWAERETIARQRLPGTPVEALSILYVFPDKQSMIYGLTMPTVPAKTELLMQETEKAFKSMPSIQSSKVEAAPAKNGYEQFKISATNNMNNVTTREHCMFGNGKNYLVVCASSQKYTQAELEAIINTLQYL